MFFFLQNIFAITPFATTSEEVNVLTDEETQVQTYDLPKVARAGFFE